MSFSTVWLLVSANVKVRLGRFLAASMAISFATAILLAALTGRQVLRTQAPEAAKGLLGPKELHLAATDTVHPFLDESLIESMRDDPRVSHLSTAVSVRAVDMPGTEGGKLDIERFYNLKGGGNGGWIPGRRERFLAWQDDTARSQLVSGQWPSIAETDPIEILIPAIVWGQQVGSWRRLESDTGVHRARVVGVLPADSAMVTSTKGARLASRQISPAAAEKLAGRSLLPSDARVTLNRFEDKESFRDDWQERIALSPGQVELWDNSTIEQAGLASPTAEGARIAVQSAILLASACVMCIAFSVQGNAVRERAAQHSLLRSLGAARTVLFTLVITEAIVLAVAGVIGAVALVWAAMSGLAIYLPMLRVPSSPAPISIALAGVVTLLGVLVGAVWPAYVASRSLPGEFVVHQVDPSRTARMAKWSAVAGLMIAAFTALVIAATPLESLVRAELITWIGVPGLALTAVLLTPLVIRWTCRLFVRAIAWLTWTEPVVLSDHIASDGARSAGSIIAISIGLGGFIWMLCWGTSMLDSFIIDPAMPRWLVSIHPYGLNHDEAEQLLATSKFREYHPLTLVDTHLNNTDEATPTLVMGIDLRRSLSKGPNALPFRFIEGERELAITELEHGNACLVSAWYAASHDTQIGDLITVAAPSGDGHGERTYRVAGVVELKGWRMATKLNKVRYHGNKHQMMLVLDAQVVHRDFPVADVNFLVGNPETNTDGNIPGFRSDLSKEEAYAASREARESVESAVAVAVDLSQPIQYQPDGQGTVVVESRVVQVDDLDRTRASLRGEWGGAAVKRMGQVPLCILVLSLFSVSGTLVVSLQSRCREIGVLRSCGITRFGLVRLAIAEALLLGLASLPIAALLGGVGAWLTLEVASVVGFRLDFAGIQPDFTVPWSWLWPGVAVTLVVCCVAAIWAAWRVGRIPIATLVSSSSWT